MPNSQKALEVWTTLKEKIISLKKISDSWLELKMDVTNITEKFTKISPQLGQISYKSTNEQVTEVLEKVVDSLESLEEYQVCQKELEFAQAKIEYWLKKVKEINSPISNLFNTPKTKDLNDLQNNISEYLKQQNKKALFRKRK